jgi:GTP-binding protein Era
MSRSGSVALVGRPNAGKSTLMNRLLEEKLAIVSNKPQTTRQRMVGILTAARGQMVFFDTPGIHRPLHRLNRQMVRHALDALNEADVRCLLVDVSEPFGAGDSYMLDLLAKAEAPRILALNKIDRVKKPALLPTIAHYGRSGIFTEIVPISAATGDGCAALLATLWEALPEGAPLYDPELVTTHPERFLVAERIREKVLAATHEELPFATAVVIEHWEDDPGGSGLLRLHASLLVERPGQKSILVGRDGQMIKKIGTAARKDLEGYLERRVYLDLQVKLEPGWREDRGVLSRLDRDTEVDLSSPFLSEPAAAAGLGGAASAGDASGPGDAGERGDPGEASEPAELADHGGAGGAGGPGERGDPGDLEV